MLGTRWECLFNLIIIIAIIVVSKQSWITGLRIKFSGHNETFWYSLSGLYHTMRMWTFHRSVRMKFSTPQIRTLTVTSRTSLHPGATRKRVPQPTPPKPKNQGYVKIYIKIWAKRSYHFLSACFTNLCLCLKKRTFIMWKVKVIVKEKGQGKGNLDIKSSKCWFFSLWKFKWWCVKFFIREAVPVPRPRSQSAVNLWPRPPMF